MVTTTTQRRRRRASFIKLIMLMIVVVFLLCLLYVAVPDSGASTIPPSSRVRRKTLDVSCEARRGSEYELPFHCDEYVIISTRRVQSENYAYGGYVCTPTDDKACDAPSNRPTECHRDGMKSEYCDSALARLYPVQPGTGTHRVR